MNQAPAGGGVGAGTGIAFDPTAFITRPVTIQINPCTIPMLARQVERLLPGVATNLSERTGGLGLEIEREIVSFRLTCPEGRLEFIYRLRIRQFALLPEITPTIPPRFRQRRQEIASLSGTLRFTVRASVTATVRLNPHEVLRGHLCLSGLRIEQLSVPSLLGDVARRIMTLTNALSSQLSGGICYNIEQLIRPLLLTGVLDEAVVAAAATGGTPSPF